MTSESSHIPWVPKDMEWFIADLIQEFTFANGDGPLVWVNQILIRANSLEEAYENSLARGALYNSSYLNSDGVQVTECFRGLRDLYLIYDKLEDGAEILYTEYDDLDETRIAAMITPKEKLAAFVTHDKRPEKSRVEESSESNVPDDALAAANGLNQSAQARRDAGDLIGATWLYDQALLLLRKLDRPAELAYTLRHVADLHSQLGQIQKAKSEIEEAIAIYRDTPYGSALDLTNALRISVLNAEEQIQQLWQESEELYKSVKVQAGADEAHLHIQHLSKLTATGEIQ